MPPPQVPAVQVWPVTHRFPDEQGAPFATTVCMQEPVAGSQLAVWHESIGVQVTGVPVQAPLWQVVPVRHLFGEVQAVPLAAVEYVQLPVAGSQVPGVAWQMPGVVQLTDVPVQVPAWQLVLVRHLFVDVHAVPLLR